MSSAAVAPASPKSPKKSKEDLDPAAAFLAAEAGSKASKEGADDKPDWAEESDSEVEEVYTESDYDRRQADLNALDLRPRVISFRHFLTGKSTKYLEDRAAEKKAEDDKKNFVQPLTEAEIEAKERAKTKRHEMNREKSRDEALRYLEVMRISDDTIELDFYNRKMGPDDCERLSHLLMWNGLNQRRTGGLRYLILRSNAIHLDGCNHICGALKFDLAEGLRYLDLSQCGLGAEGAKLVAEMIRENKGLLELRIKENHIGETGTQYIAEALQENFTLERLSLNKNMIFDAGCKHIADVRFGNLVFLDLRDNNITSWGCKSLASGILKNTTLHYLNIRENCWGNEGRWAIGEAISENKKEFIKAQREVRKYQQKEYKAKYINAKKGIEKLRGELALARRNSNLQQEGSILARIGISYDSIGQCSKAIDFLKEALIIARDIGDRQGEANTLGCLCISYKNCGNFSKAMEHYLQVAIIARELGVNTRNKESSLGTFESTFAKRPIEEPIFATDSTPYGFADSGESPTDQIHCPTPEQIGWALPAIDFDGIRCECMPFYGRYVHNEPYMVRTQKKPEVLNHPTPRGLQTDCVIS